MAWIDTTYIKLARQIISWEWYTDCPTCHLFIHLILSANYAADNYKGESVRRGQLSTTYKKLATATGLTVKQVRRALSNLKTTGEIDVVAKGRYSLITVNNYNKFQSSIKEIEAKAERKTDSKKAIKSEPKKRKEVPSIEMWIDEWDTNSK